MSHDNANTDASEPIDAEPALRISVRTLEYVANASRAYVWPLQREEGEGEEEEEEGVPSPCASVWSRAIRREDFHHEIDRCCVCVCVFNVL